MDHELSTIIHRNEGNWMYSGQDNMSLSELFKAELYSDTERRRIRVIIMPEETTNFLMPIVASTGSMKGTVPTYSCRYFPITCANRGEETINRILQLLRLNGTSEDEINKVNAYINYLLYLEEITYGHASDLNIDLIIKYSAISAVECAIDGATIHGRISEREKRALLERYAEVKNAGPILENFLSVLNNTFYLQRNREKGIASLKNGDSICFQIKNDMAEQQRNQLFQLIAWDIIEAGRSGHRISISIVEGRRKFGGELLNLFSQITGYAKLTLYTRDFFTGHTLEWQDTVNGYFDAWIYGTHESMKSCEAISESFGAMPIVRSSYSYDRDRRLSNNSLIDRLLNTNRIDHYVEHVPSWEPKFRKEEIYCMGTGICLVKFHGEGCWVQL